MPAERPDYKQVLSGDKDDMGRLEDKRVGKRNLHLGMNPPYSTTFVYEDGMITT